MNKEYSKLTDLPDDLHLIHIVNFISPIKNASLTLDSSDRGSVPVFYVRFKDFDKDGIDFYSSAVRAYPWKLEWILEPGDNNKWLLYPKRLYEVEKKLSGKEGKEVNISRSASAWLLEHEREYVQKANIDIEGFRRYLRKEVEKYLDKKI